MLEDFLVTWAVGVCTEDPMPPFESLEPVNQALIEFGRTVDAIRLATANQRIQKAARELVAFFDDYDVLVTPTVAGPPPIIGSYRDPDNPIAELLNAAALVPFTPPWNTTGQPAVSLPLHTDELGLPVGVQIVGAHGRSHADPVVSPDRGSDALGRPAPAGLVGGSPARAQPGPSSDRTHGRAGRLCPHTAQLAPSSPIAVRLDGARSARGQRERRRLSWERSASRRSSQAAPTCVIQRTASVSGSAVTR